MTVFSCGKPTGSVAIGPTKEDFSGDIKALQDQCPFTCDGMTLDSVAVAADTLRILNCGVWVDEDILSTDLQFWADKDSCYRPTLAWLAASCRPARNLLEKGFTINMEVRGSRTRNHGVALTCAIRPDDIDSLVVLMDDSVMSRRAHLHAKAMLMDVTCPQTIGSGLSIQEATTIDTTFVLVVIVDEEEHNMDKFGEYKDETRDSLCSDLITYMSDADLAFYKECEQAGMSFIYRYVGDTTGKTFDITFSPVDLRGMVLMKEMENPSHIPHIDE